MDKKKLIFNIEKFFSSAYQGSHSCAPNRNWVVHYSDGVKSVPMDKGNAFGYLSIFGGSKIEKVKGMWRRSVENPKVIVK